MDDKEWEGLDLDWVWEVSLSGQVSEPGVWLECQDHRTQVGEEYPLRPVSLALVAPYLLVPASWVA